MPLSTWVASNSSSAHRAFTTFLKEHFFATAVSDQKLDADAINRIKEAFQILKALFRASPISTRGAKCGQNPWQLQHFKARDAFRGATTSERGFTSVWDRWQNDAAYKQSQLVHNWSDAWVRYLDHIVQFSIFHKAPQQQRERHMHIHHLRRVDENKQAPPLSQKPVYREVREQLRKV